MSHPIPGHDYSESQPRRNSTQRAMAHLLKKTADSYRRKNEHPFSHLKRIAGGPRSQALERKKGKRTPEEEGEMASDYERGN